MPQTPKVSQSQAKKAAAAAAKAKGAVRAKTGCYTCRIRRKKCDEERTDKETCKTCERLRLECLGFGTKRPEWLRENRNVVMLRDKIKVFLASQGLIKGHSGTGSRSTDQGGAILRLSGDPSASYHSSGSESPSHYRTLSLSDDDDPRHRLQISSVRDQREVEPAWFNPYGQVMHRSDTPYSNSSLDEMNHHHQHPYTLQNSSGSLADDPSRISPAIRSTFSKWYTEMPYDLMDGLEGSFNNDLSVVGISYGAPSLSQQDHPSLATLYTMPTDWMPTYIVEQSIEQYVQMIAEIQYLLGDKTLLPSMIWDSYQTHQNSKTALTLLNKVYWRRQQHPDRPVLTDSEMSSNLHSLLAELQKGRFDDPDDAIAALHGVSMYLFDGGQGAWRDFLALATKYVKKILHHPSYTHPKDALLFAVPKDAFIVKTAMWFDVLGSITTEETPTFIMEIRTMFGPVQHGVYNVQFDIDPQCSMMSPMGCENRVVWALAETCMLARWKHNEDVKCRLSVTELVIKAQEIDNMLYPKPYEPPTEPMSDADAELHHLRYLASEIFRCSTRLYLAAVVNNDHPQVRQIQDRVEESMVVFRNLFQTPSTVDLYKVSRSVIRSTVFGLYLTGSLTQNREHRQHLLEHINRESVGANQNAGEGVGNCGSIRKMLEHVWKESDADPAKPVPWRRVLKECQILLV